MEAKVMIELIQKSNKLEDVILNMSDFLSEYKGIAKALHPDVCNLPGAGEALSKLNEWKEIFKVGKSFNDDAGVVRTNGYWAKFSSSEPCLGWSQANYDILLTQKDTKFDVFKKYIPKSGKLLSDAVTGIASFNLDFEKRAIPVSGLVLPQEHVNWILNRMLEYAAYLSNIGMVHAGFTPESVFIVPETHGIQVCSFYHMTKEGNKIGTISGQYAGWYPKSVFDTKIATQAIDIQMAKNIAIYLLGDKSGSGTSLRKTHNKDFVNFLLTHHTNAYAALSEYRAMLSKNFKKEFHVLNL